MRGIILAVVLLSACGGGWVGGIHARLAWSDTRGLRVVEVPAGAAARAGLRANDHVTMIDHETIQGMSQQEVVERLRGPVGSRVTLTVERDGQPTEIEIERAPYE
ncbi:MAG: PDZ domain-containing protein [Sandaracinaceae bacterium]|nr:PDZ domain-containing protein [Sandaracinaceae bacterium]